MFVRQTTRQTHRGNKPSRPQGALDAAALLLQLDMAALVRQAGDSLRQHRDAADQREQRPWWRRLFGQR